MPKWMSKDAKSAARQADLYDFLIEHHSDDVKNEGSSLRLRDNHSVSVKRGYCGYKDFATGDTGNSIDFLVNYLGYDFQEAVAALSGAAPVVRPSRKGPSPGKASVQAAAVKPEDLPEPAPGPWKQLYAYLYQSRRIPRDIIDQLVRDRLLYQAKEHNNLVFVNPDRTFAELRGSNTYAPFHRVMFTDPAAFWWCKSGGVLSIVQTAYICESAIDAVSLLCLKLCSGDTTNGLYCGIGGVENQQRIDAIRAGMAAAGLQAVIAVDNDPAGEHCRQRNPGLQAIVPRLKDWNEDLYDFTERRWKEHGIRW